MEEWDVEGSTATLTCYTLGDDVIAQKKTYWQWFDPQWELQSTGNTQYLLYDGHGSTRQLAEYNTEVSIVDSFSYDGYGVLLQNEGNFVPPDGTQDPGKVTQQATSLLYAGEHFDTDMQNYYLRARWYDSLTGRFNRMDPFPGNNQDPQSLHKYLYAHCNPINGIDPEGLFSLKEINVTALIQATLFTMNYFGAVYHAKQTTVSVQQVYNEWVMGDFWGGLPYVVMAILHSTFLVLNVIGMVTAMKPPPSIGLFPALVSVGTSGTSQFWVTVTSNPALANWVVKTVGPAAMSVYIAFFESRGGGISSGRSGGSQRHHRIPYGNKKYDHSQHPLVKKAGWTKADLEKNPANIMRLGNHGGRHSDAYHEAIDEMLTQTDRGLSGGGREAARRALRQVLNDIDEKIANGTLKPYANKNVWIEPGE